MWRIVDDRFAVRAQSFGQVAELYDRWRPDYPDALYDDVLRTASGGRVLEAGAGTGRATAALARRGASVLAVEPDPAMATIARRRTRGMAVGVHESTFVGCNPAVGTFDLVVAAQAWHWIDGERGAIIAARALRPGGALCLWWNRPRALNGMVWDAVHDAYALHAPALDRRHAVCRQSDREKRFPPAQGFAPWSHFQYDWTATYDAESYTGLLRTRSDHLQLPVPQRERLIDAIREVIVETGGDRLEYRYRAILVTAPKL
jgi:SAM-dependent methyltransferase